MTENMIYLRRTIEGMTSQELIAFMYQEVLRSLHMARLGFEHRDIEERVNGINRALSFIGSLSGVLDQEQGGEIAAHLRALYTWAIGELGRSNMHNEPRRLTGVEKIFTELASAWSSMMQQVGAVDFPKTVTPAEESPAAARVSGGGEWYG